MSCLAAYPCSRQLKRGPMTEALLPQPGGFDGVRALAPQLPAVMAPTCNIIPRSSRTTQCSAIRPSITR
jgi:hypothetical protein